MFRGHLVWEAFVPVSLEEGTYTLLIASYVFHYEFEFIEFMLQMILDAINTSSFSQNNGVNDGVKLSKLQRLILLQIQETPSITIQALAMQLTKGRVSFMLPLTDFRKRPRGRFFVLDKLRNRLFSKFILIAKLDIDIRR